LGVDLPLDDGEVDLHLVEPTGMDRRVNQDHAWVTILQAPHCAGAAVSRAVVDNPEEAARIVVRRPGHYLLDQPVKRFNAILFLAATKDPGMVNVQTSRPFPR
jgi:hypothetical protein